MNVAGIDCGAKNTKAVILSNGKIRAMRSISSGFDYNRAAEKVFDLVLEEADLSRENVIHIAVTGAGKKEVTLAQSAVTVLSADAKAAHHLFPLARTVIDVGAEEARAIRLNEAGKLIDFAINEKCAAGAGTFVETMALALEVSMEEIGPLSLRSERELSMKAQCAVFAESEVISLIHANYSKADISRAVHEAIADRIAAMARKVGLERDIVLIGGMSRNEGFVDSLKRVLKEDVQIPDNPEFLCAYGAAVKAAEKARQS